MGDRHPYFSAEKPRVLAHRGLVPRDSAGVVDNTVAAFAAAHAAGAEYIESDCHVTADGVVVLFHDTDLVRVAGDSRRVADVPHDELAHLMAGLGGLATAADTLAAFPDVRFNLDVKAPDAAVPLGRIVAPHADRVLLTSFADARRRAAMDAARAAGGTPATSAGQATVARVLAGVASGSRTIVRRALRGIHALQVPERTGALRIVGPRFLRLVHEAGVEVHVWTVNDPLDMERLLDLGVDGLVTDRADLALQVTRRRTQ
ncbi:MAG: glycerophosphodiester phosphodiesterase [Microbacterium sp.]|nr:MAG: glycerophosphodiester phosphodiesterase [Microbacterium sp.]